MYHYICIVLCVMYTCRVFCVGSADMNTHVYAAERLEQLVIFSTGGHRDAVVGGFFFNNSLDVSLHIQCITH